MEKKKVGIVTFHTGNNYGAVLQAYALQEYVSKQGFDVKIMNFNPLVYDSYDKIFKRVGGGLLSNAARQFFQLLHYCELKKRIERFKEFQDSQYHLTKKRYLTEEDFLKNHETFDYYISGSDQVFNPRVKYSDCYFLAFDKKEGKKIAYAPSMGISEFTKEEEERIKRHIIDFDHLSCRETNGAEFLSQLVDRPVPTVCDPVFLLSKKEWLENAVAPKKTKQPYIFVYDLNGGQGLMELVKKVSHSSGIKTIVCATLNTRKRYKGVKSIRSLGPRELLGFINGAEYVVTDSFHGTSLSLVMGKKVLPYIALAKTSSRIVSIMTKLGVEEQIVYDLKGFMLDDIRFEHYEERLDEYISESKLYLKNVLA